MLSDEVKRLEVENVNLKRENTDLKNHLELKSKIIKHYKDCCTMVIPEKLYVCKKRRNTTIRFKDGSCMTVKRKAGEKDCIETAIAYCILKQLLTASDVKKLIKEREEH